MSFATYNPFMPISAAFIHTYNETKYQAALEEINGIISHLQDEIEKEREERYPASLNAFWASAGPLTYPVGNFEIEEIENESPSINPRLSPTRSPTSQRYPSAGTSNPPSYITTETSETASPIFSRSSSVASNTPLLSPTPTLRTAEVTQPNGPYVICRLPHGYIPGQECSARLYTPTEVKAHLNASEESNGHDIRRKSKSHRAITNCAWPSCDAQIRMSFQYDHTFGHMVGFPCKECNHTPYKSITALIFHMDSKGHIQYRDLEEEEFMVFDANSVQIPM